MVRKEEVAFKLSPEVMKGATIRTAREKPFRNREQIQYTKARKRGQIVIAWN